MKLPYSIEKLNIEDYDRCSNIRDIKNDPYHECFLKDMERGNRIVYIYKENGEFIAEIAMVFEMEDRDYTIPGQRIYLSRLIVKEEYRGQGIGGILIDYMVKKIQEMGYHEISIGVDKENTAALHLYRKKGFTTVLYEGADQYGEYYKLMKVL